MVYHTHDSHIGIERSRHYDVIHIAVMNEESLLLHLHLIQSYSVVCTICGSRCVYYMWFALCVLYVVRVVCCPCYYLLAVPYIPRV